MDRKTSNILLGIGGSGARCVEAFLHLASAGIGPADVSVCIVDQDAANGNSSDALSLLSQLKLLQSVLKQVGGHRIPDACSFLGTAISDLGNDGLWSPALQGNSRRPHSYFRADTMTAGTRALFDALYSQAEQTIELDQGYHGRPNIGAAVLTANVLLNDDFLKALVDKIVAGAGAGQDTRIFLVGSIFGGTGAAGFPTIARLISRHPDVMKKRDSVRIGGALLLPYFQFSDTGDDERAVRARAASFLRNAEGALRYYDTIEQEGGVYDALYVAGLDPYLTRQNLGLGGKTQNNPPMLPELLGALAAVRHFSLESMESGEVHISGRAARHEFTWEDMPSPATTDAIALTRQRVDLRQRLGSAVRFAFSFCNIYRPVLGPGMSKALTREVWFRRHLSRQGVAIESEAQDALGALNAYLKRFLHWTAAMSIASEVKGVFSVRLFEVDRYAQVANTAGNVELKEQPKRQDFPYLVCGRKERDLHAVLHDLTYQAPMTGGHGLGQFISSLHQACRLT
ncbi:MAG: hypothetical protein QOJ15_941 [Bradyrhizobium sp.]|jgi:hypothetical protein|nr:hypothetical protein [Bradyrhizobium sp.]